MIIERPQYLNQLAAEKDRDIVKVITGIRRSGKSVLLFTLFYKYLIEHGVKKEHIITVDLETQRNKSLRNADNLYGYVTSRITEDERYYVFLDEIQMVDEFEDVVNGLRVDHGCDVYITGSNSKLLSKEINTKFRGRSTEIRIFPLSFKEYCSSRPDTAARAESFNDYLLYGGLPYITSLDRPSEKVNYLNNICSTVIINDIVERYSIRNENMLEAVFDFLCSNIGSFVSANKIANTLKSNGYTKITVDTVGNYLEYMRDAFLFYKVQRFDIKGRAYLKTQHKYYISDLGIRNARLNYRQVEITHSLENLVYLELLRRGYSVDVGKNNEKEIDFVARNERDTYYIQVAYSVADPEKRKQELGSFKNIDDGYKKILLTMDNDPFVILENGYKKLSVYDFLEDAESLRMI